MSINDRVAGGARRNALCWLREDMSKKFSQQGFRFSKKRLRLGEVKNRLAQLFPYAPVEGVALIGRRV